MTAAGMFEQVWRETVGKLRDRGPDRRVQVPAVGAMWLGDWTVTRVISVAAHGVDVALTLRRVPRTTPSALTDQDRMVLGPLQGRFPLLS
jgi:hypothetical protein